MRITRSKLFTALPAVILAGGATAHAQAPAPDTTFIFNTLLFLIMGMVVMFMAAGFCMLEAGSVRAKNTAAICLKNITLYSIAGLMVWLCGYNMIYGIEEGGYVNNLLENNVWSADDSDPLGTGYSAGSDWFFQMVFVATAASIVSGTLAERIRVWPFFIFTAILTGFIYPIQASWEWGAGWLDAKGFSDFAGSTLVHATGGWAALAGAIALGARKGKYDGTVEKHEFYGASMPLATLGVFILWLGWFGFNGGSQLALGSLDDSIAVSDIFIHTNMAAASGVVTVVVLSTLLLGKISLPLALNGAIGGLVSITAEPLMPDPVMDSILLAVIIGAIGGTLVFLVTPLLDALRIDDVVGAIPAHLACGIWGTLVVPLSNKEVSIIAQGTGVLANAGFVFGVSLVLWFFLKFTIGIRSTAEHEDVGLDIAETGAPGINIVKAHYPAE
ncbi:ammonium transporter [Parvularcula marina]|uniref:Ammonium transporter n=1 Tax=Parvularcula marina TaxID=2292771 RepID=A0A371R7M0_9PROT|nr:ammonium transporter [Parvularcula marina]RFB01429.1 ammonium transporter [Parvularcula marina]